MNYKQRDIVLVNFPFSDNSASKLRPALIISSELVHQTGDLMLMMITSKDKNDGLNIPIDEKDLDKKLPLKSFLRFHKIFVLKSDLILRRLSVLSSSKYEETVSKLEEIIRQE